MADPEIVTLASVTFSATGGQATGCTNIKNVFSSGANANNQLSVNLININPLYDYFVPMTVMYPAQ